MTSEPIHPQPESAPVRETKKTLRFNTHGLIYDLLLVLILLVGGYFRLIGVNWDDHLYLHPDERFLYMVEGAIEPVEELGDYFDTVNASLNPHNRGFGFFVYGTFPIIFTRYVAEWMGEAGYGYIHVVARPLSAAADLLVVLLVYFVAQRLYDKRVGVLAAAFSAFAVLQIQLSHFFTVDTFTNLFTLLALYYAVRASLASWRGPPAQEASEDAPDTAPADAPPQDVVARYAAAVFRHPLLIPSVMFGVGLGLAVASKISSVPVVLALPFAGLIYLSRIPKKHWLQEIITGLIVMGVGAFVSLLVFRVAQPYAFEGPGFFDVGINEAWMDNIRTLRAQATTPDPGFPPSVQWFDRPLWYSGQNLLLWGVGIPMGLLSLFGFLWMGWRMWKGEWRTHALMWGWAALYFVWQSFVWNRTMRYQLPVYPAIAIFAAWAVIRLWDIGSKWIEERKLQNEGAELQPSPGIGRYARPLALAVGGFAVAGAFLWALAFSQIYTRPVTRVAASRWMYAQLPGPLTFRFQTADGPFTQQHPIPYDYGIQPNLPYVNSLQPRVSGTLHEVVVAHIVEQEPVPGPMQLTLSVSSALNGEPTLGEAALDVNLAEQSGGVGSPFVFTFDPPLALNEGQEYYLFLNMLAGGGKISLAGTAVTNESSWDDVVPQRLDGYDAWGGIFQSGLNFEMYWPDTADKVARMTDILDNADVIAISSSRQWGSLTRLTDLYPLTIAFYHNLMGCPEDRTVEWCYNAAEEGMFQGTLGYDLLKIFDSSPNLGPIVFNDQPSDEAFTVYDHPKVFLFVKSDAYDSAQARAILESVSLPVPGATASPAEADLEQPKSLLLPPDRLEGQQAGGTFSELYSVDGLLNRFQPLGVLVWYLAVLLLGLVAYPIVRLALPGLPDGGYPLARTAGLLLLSYIVWLAGSASIPFNRLTITGAFVLLLLVSGLLAYRQRDALAKTWRSDKRYLLSVEALALALFLFMLLIRWGNPDLWHPWKGGEKPMDFAYFNAVLKSTTFPPYDPWFAGGYINYYYYGFVYIGVLVKWLRIVPAFAYNLALPTLFSMTGLGAFSLGWNLMRAGKRKAAPKEPAPAAGDDAALDNIELLPAAETPAAETSAPLAVPAAPAELPAPAKSLRPDLHAYLVGLAAAIATMILGNFGTVRMIFQGYQRLAAPPGVIFYEHGFIQQWTWAVQGFFQVLSGATLPYGIGDWYWLPSRAIPGMGDIEPITEFPFFTFIYADLHAHMIALPITMLALAWAVSAALSRGRWGGWLAAAVSFVLGGLAIGALRPTNTWDFPTYLALGIIAIVYTVWRRNQPDEGGLLAMLPAQGVRAALAVLGIAALAVLSVILFQPFVDWYALGYTKVSQWQGSKTPLTAYFTHWGLFLFVIASWMLWETREWLAATPLSAIHKLRAMRNMITAAIFLLGIWLLALLYWDVSISWFVLLLAAWAGALLLRPEMPDAKRIILFLVGSGLTLTLVVEVIVLSGDIGRMNTVFKFYLQVWTLFALSAAAAFGWLLSAWAAWRPRWRMIWQVAAGMMLFAAALYPLLGGMAKFKDRMSSDAPHTLDGMAYMPYGTYGEQGRTMTLDEDYQAIQWLQNNVEGSPVLVEGHNLPYEYRWGQRYAIYTGLPNVVGWGWHQRQQRAFAMPGEVEMRLAENELFYRGTEAGALQEFIDKYNVGYIVVGQLERAYFDGLGIEKFEQFNGQLWHEVFRSGETVIYKVIE